MSNYGQVKITIQSVVNLDMVQKIRQTYKGNAKIICYDIDGIFTHPQRPILIVIKTESMNDINDAQAYARTLRENLNLTIQIYFEK
jgi:hypothetical protein